MNRPDTAPDLQRRRGVRRTAWLVALVAVAIYGGFMLRALVS